MPEPKVRKQAAAKKKRKQHEEDVAARAQKSGESVEDTREALRYESRKGKADEVKAKKEAALAQDPDESDTAAPTGATVLDADTTESASTTNTESTDEPTNAELAKAKAAKSKPAKGRSKANQASADWARKSAPGSRRWVPPTFITIGLLGVLWLVTYYIGQEKVPFMNKLGDWNILIGMGLMGLSFVVATLWK